MIRLWPGVGGELELRPFVKLGSFNEDLYCWVEGRPIIKYVTQVKEKEVVPLVLTSGKKEFI